MQNLIELVCLFKSPTFYKLCLNNIYNTFYIGCGRSGDGLISSIFTRQESKAQKCFYDIHHCLNSRHTFVVIAQIHTL